MRLPTILLSLAFLYFFLGLSLSHAQNIIFEAGFNNTLLSAEEESPTNASGNSFTDGLDAEGLLVENEDVLKYAVSNNILANGGSITVWVKPNWSPGEVLRRILVVESSPVFELHVDESGSLVFAMFSDQIETRIASGYVGGWNTGDWHFLTFTWNADKIEIYVDGSRITEAEVGFDIPAFEAGVFGVGSLGGNDPFDGILDELKIYDAPLSNTQIIQQYETKLGSFPTATSIKLIDIFGRDVTDGGITLVDWEGPVRNPAMKYLLQGNDSLSYPLSITLSTSEERTSFSLPSTISPTGPTKTVVLDSKDALESFLFSYYMDENFEDESFDLTLTYSLNGLPVRQFIPVTVIDQDRDRPLSYEVIVDFSEASHPLMLDPETQAVITQAAEDWLYYIDGEGIDEIPVGESSMVVGGQDHFFAEKTVTNSVPYTGFYLFAFGNSNDGPCVCSTGSPNRELLQTSNGEVVPIFRIGGLHLNVFGQAFETEPTGWEVLSPFENWTLQNDDGTPLAATDMYFLAKHEIGHAMVFENSPLFLEAQGRDPNNPFPDESLTPPPNGFRSPAITAYYPDEVVPLFINSLSHVIDVLDPASQVPPYGGGVPVEVMPLGREMLTKLDILIMESVGYPLRENEVTKALSLTSENDFRGAMEVDFEANLSADGGIPVYHYTVSDGNLPIGISLNSRTGMITGTPEEEGEFPVTFLVKDYDERSPGATFSTTIRIGNILSSEAELLSYTFDTSISIVETSIDATAQTLYFLVESGTNITELRPQIEISEGASITPAADAPQDFTNPVSYTITSEDGMVEVIWTVILDVVVLALDDDVHPMISVYPNPANQELHVEISKSSLLPAEMKLFDMQGHLLKSANHHGKTISIPTDDLSTGLYLLRVFDQIGMITTQKIAIDH